MTKHEMTLVRDMVVRLTEDGPYYEHNDNICKITDIKYCDECARLHYTLMSLKNGRSLSQFIDDHMIKKVNTI